MLLTLLRATISGVCDTPPAFQPDGSLHVLTHLLPGLPACL